MTEEKTKIEKESVNKAITMYNKIKKWLAENRHVWLKEVDDYIAKLGERNVRVFQTYFRDPDEASDGIFVFFALSQRDVAMLYPDLVDAAKKTPIDNYLYIFNCDNTFGDKALRIHSYVN